MRFGELEIIKIQYSSDVGNDIAALKLVFLQKQIGGLLSQHRRTFGHTIRLFLAHYGSRNARAIDGVVWIGLE